MSDKPADKVTKILVKLIDYSIFPAILVVSTKLLGILVFINFFNVEYKISGLKLVMNNADDYTLVNSYSSLLMLASIAAGLALIIFKAHVTHNTHIAPALSAKVHDMNLEEIINSTKTIYSQSFIWVAYVWLVTIVLGIQAHFMLSYTWVFYASLGVTLISSGLLWFDLRREFKADKNLFFKVKKLGKGLFSDYLEQELA